MSDPLNYEGPLAADVVQRVSDFLLRPVKNTDGGWTEVSREDWTELVILFENIIDAKFERDADGDHTIEFETCHRKQGRMQTIHIPYHLDTTKDMEQATHAISMASGIIEHMSKRMQYKYSEQRLLERRVKKMQPVINFCASNGHIRAHDRIKTYINGEGSLFIGKDDGVWSPLGLTCAEIKQTQSDNYGPGYHDAVDDLLLTAVQAMEG